MVLWLGRKLQVLGAGKRVLLGCFLPFFTFSCPLSGGAACHGPGPQTLCSISQVCGSRAQLPTPAWETVSSPCSLLVLWGVGILLAQGPVGHF